MSNPLHAAYYADQASLVRTEIIEQEVLARDTVRVRMAAPKIVRRVVPGQFVMLRLGSCNDPLLARPLAIYNVGEDWLDLVYLVKGKFTSQLARSAVGTPLEVWGPLGNGFSYEPVQHLIMVAGGIGQTPFLTLGAQSLGRRAVGDAPVSKPRAERVTLLYGARSAEYLAGVADFEEVGIEVRLATDDGSRGEKGFVTQLLTTLLDEVASTGDATAASSRLGGDKIRIACCGPEIMMEAVSKIALARGIPCEVSLETPMACGIGICFTCVAKVKQPDGEWDYKRTCVEGPIFCAEKLVW